MKKSLMCISIFLAFCVLITSCASSKYVHNDPAFSFKYPAGYYDDILRDKTQVASFAHGNTKLHSYTAFVVDKPNSLKFEDLPEAAIKEIQRIYPKSSVLNILEQKKIRLSDGTDAMAMKFKWRFMRSMPDLQTSIVMAPKDDKIIAVAGTSGTLSGYYISLEEMMKYCMTLKIN